MGALHEGHLTLVRRSLAECGFTVCSIFVNPTQFNDPGDLKRYPRTPEKDRKMLEKAGCQALFTPPVDEMYPGGESENGPDLGAITTVLEGAHRPGHFKGVAQVVHRFFDIVRPHRAYFGAKDHQQVMVIRKLVRRFDLGVEVVACPIVREPDGLAMSSRNALLSAEERSAASLIPKLMQEAATIARQSNPAKAKQYVAQRVSKEPLFRLDYYEICDPTDLQPLPADRPPQEAISLIAVHVGKIRLIDNQVI